MYEVGTYNSEAVAAARWRRCKMAARGKVAACGSSAVGQGGGDGGAWRAARWRRPRSHFLNDRETNPGLAGVPTVTCYNIDRLRASAQTMPGLLIIFLRQKNPTRHKKALTLYTLSFWIIPVIVFEKNPATTFFVWWGYSSVGIPKSDLLINIKFYLKDLPRFTYFKLLAMHK